MGEGDFAGHGETTSADEGDRRNGVVRAAEGTHGHQRGALGQFARHAVDFGRFEGFAQGEGWHDGWQALCHHRLAGAWAAHEQDVVSSGTGDLKGAFDILLPSNFGKIVGENALGLGELGARVHHRRLQGNVAVEELHHLGEVVYAIDVEVVDDGGFQRIGARQDKAVEFEFARQDGHGEGALDGTQAAVKRQFPHEHVAVQTISGYFLVGSEDAYCQRQVIGRPFFLDVGRRHVHHDLFAWELVPRLLDGAPHAFGALLDSRIGQADDHESSPKIDRHFDLDLDGVDAMHCRCNRSR